ncbi:MAG: replication and repair protein RecN [Candidatus Sulfotelmatobacter sp.]|nr:replication and repair protein RecN [Candidatus Sulfotelmatobacter sp.]
MLVELRLENYAVIDNAAVEFASGLNLLTGETGAGKSILIDALALLLGDKASSEVIRNGADRAVVSAVFECEGDAQEAIEKVLEKNGLDESEDGSLIVRREIAAGGKGRAFVNNQPATVAVLRQLAPHLATIHAQNESILSFDAPSRLALLDGFAESQIEPVTSAYETWKGISTRIEDLERGEQDRLRLVDLWMFQRKEIEDAKVQSGEDAQLETEKRVLANAEKIYNAAMHAFDLLYEGDASTSSSLRSAQKQIEELARYEPKFQEALAALETARISVEDVGATVRDYAGGIHASPEHLAEVEDRLAALDRLKRKYGPTLEDVIAFGADVALKLSEIENKDEILRALRSDLAKASEEYLRASRSLSKKRQDAARKLEKLVESQINDLAMKSTFRIEITTSDAEGNWSATGIDQVLYMISTNPGEPMRQLEHIASGGELSRVMLALKVSVEAGRQSMTSQSTGRQSAAGQIAAGQIAAAEQRGRAALQGRVSGSNSSRALAPVKQRTMVFDEIDTGIGGRAAESVGKKLKSLARSNQVLCVTHLPQIATFADHHYVIEKKERNGRTRTGIRPVVAEERTEEVARMLSGAKLTDTSRKHAEQMIKANA